MTILEIKPAKQHQNTLRLSNGSEILLDKDTCIENGLTSEMEIDDQTLEALRAQSEYTRARSRALWLLDRMDYTEKKLYEKLISKGFDKKICAKVLADLTCSKIVDDRRFGERVTERLMEAGVSKREAMQKLLYKGFPYDLAKELLAEFEVDEETVLLGLLEKKYSQKLFTENGEQKVYAALVRKGFSYSGVRDAINKYKTQTEFGEEC